MSFSPRSKILTEAQLSSMRFHLGELNKIALFDDKPQVKEKEEIIKEAPRTHSPFKWMFAFMLLFLFVFVLVMIGIFMYMKAIS